MDVGATGRANGATDLTVALGGRALPVVREVDLLVVGGSFAGVAFALEHARAGRRVALVEPRTYLGREATATLRLWARTASGGAPFPEPLAACARASGAAAGAGGEPLGPNAGEVPLKPDAVKVTLEELLLADGVDVLYASLPVAVLTDASGLTGVVIANKSGRQVVGCSVVVDATETALLSRLAGGRFEAPAAPVARVSRVVELDHVAPLDATTLRVPEHLGLAGGAVRLHRGYRGPDHVLVELELDLPRPEASSPDDGGACLTGAMLREVEARRRTTALAVHLIRHAPAFARAQLAASSYELSGAATTRLAGPAPDWARAHAARLSLPGPDGAALEASVADFAGPIAGLWTLQEAARLPEAQAALLREPAVASALGAALARALLAGATAPGRPLADPSRPTPTTADAPTAPPPTDADAPLAPPPTDADAVLPSTPTAREAPVPPTRPAPDGPVLRELDAPQRGRAYPRRAAPDGALPLLRSADVLVVGGGTSGATAAAAAAREGASTVLVELNPGLGGTGTLGGVDSYWYGNRVAFAARVSTAVEALHRSIGHTHKVWNIEAKMQALLGEATQAGVELFWNAIAFGALAETNRVRGVAVATRYGPFGIVGQVVVDATGDGDVAAFAGAEAVYGAARDRGAMWYSLAQFMRPGRTRNNFTSMVDVTNVQDYTRAILAGRRRGGDCHDHGVYVASRETRHILGDVVLTLTDHLLQRRWPDVVNIHFSHHDMKGKSWADWVNAGLIPPNLRIEVPYRCLLPRGLEGVLVVGKAFSTTHDSLATVRMQPDMENLGGGAGVAAAMAVRAGCTTRELDVAALQRRLVGEGLLPEEVLTRRLEPRQLSDDDLAALVDALDGAEPLHAHGNMEPQELFRDRLPFVEVCTAGARAVPHLERALEAAQGRRRVILAQALALCGAAAGVPTLIAEIEAALSGGALPPLVPAFQYVGKLAAPNCGGMPDVCFLLYTLGLARDRRSLAVWRRVADLLDPTEQDFEDGRTGAYYYVDAVCCGVERLGDPEAVPVLEKLHAAPPLRDQSSRAAFEADVFLERRASLELAIGRALARCASPSGYRVLISYLDDTRALLAEHAHDELVAITGQDYGKDAAAWTRWLAAAASALAPRPMLERFDLPDQAEVLLRDPSETGALAVAP